MARVQRTANQPKSPGQSLRPYYPSGGPKASFWKRVGRVLLWAVVVAIVAAIVAYISLQTGGAALPAGMALAKYLLIQAGVGFAEGMLYGGLSEVLGNKQAQIAIDSMGKQKSRQPKVERISQQQVEAEIRQAESMRQAQSKS